MRALCGAIITAGAVIGLGLTALGIGTRYTREGAYAPGGEAQEHLVRLSQMDRPLVFILVFLTTVAVIGLGITFLGLAYHHLRREREHHLQRARHGPQQRTTV